MRRSLRSERVKLPRVHRVTKNGIVYKYHRITRTELPRDVPEDHATFIEAWAAEEAKAPESPVRGKQGTIDAAVELFVKSGAYRDLSDSYRPVIYRHVMAIKEQAGSALVADLRSRHIAANLDPLTPAVARSRLKAWRKICGFWTARGLIADDVSKAVSAKPMPKTEGHKEWSRADVSAFRGFWHVGTPQRHAMELLQWTGARCVDVVRLGPGMIDRDGLLVFTQVKTKVKAYVPWTAPAIGLEAERKTLLDLPVNNLVFLTTNYGRPRSHKGFSQWFSAAASQAELPDLSAHGLRKYRMNELAEAGASVLQMQAWVGHTTLAEVQEYIKRVNRRRAFVRVDRLQSGASDRDE